MPQQLQTLIAHRKEYGQRLHTYTGDADEWY